MKNLLFILYAFILLLLAIFSYVFIDPNLIYYKNIFSNFAFQNRLITSIIYVFFVALLFVFYIILIRLFKQKKLGVKDIKTLLIIICSILLFSYPAMLSYDIFNYIATAKVLFFYHENPYIIMPIEFIGDPMLLFTHAANKLALYGPGWILLTGIPHFLGFGDFFFTVISFKLISILFYLLTVYLIWKLSKNLYPVILFAFNPLVLIEVLISSHNDIVMVFFLLLTYVLLQKKKFLLAVGCFIASVLIKYATLFVLPIFIYLLWKSYKKEVINWKKVYCWSAIAMFFIFLLSPLREEMYPWYAVWILPFVFLLPEKKNIVYLSIAFSFGLMLRYVPFMYSGTHFGMTPLLRIGLMLLPVVVTGIYMMKLKKFEK
jgi:hypothetical protein